MIAILRLFRRRERGPVLIDSDRLARWLAYVAEKGMRP